MLASRIRSYICVAQKTRGGAQKLSRALIEMAPNQLQKYGIKYISMNDVRGSSITATAFYIFLRARVQ